MRSDEICCCGARGWALVVGWFQSMVCGILLLFSVCAFIWAAVEISDKKTYPDTFTVTYLQYTTNASGTEVDADIDLSLKALSPEIKAKVIAATFLVLMLFSSPLILGLTGGIILIYGVQQRNPSKLRTWFIIKIIFMAIIVLTLTFQLTKESDTSFELIILGISLLKGFFSIWVVNLHRQELLGNAAIVKAGLDDDDINYINVGY